MKLATASPVTTGVDDGGIEKQSLVYTEYAADVGDASVSVGSGPPAPVPDVAQAVADEYFAVRARHQTSGDSGSGGDGEYSGDDDGDDDDGDGDDDGDDGDDDGDGEGGVYTPSSKGNADTDIDPDMQLHLRLAEDMGNGAPLLSSFIGSEAVQQQLFEAMAQVRLSLTHPYSHSLVSPHHIISYRRSMPLSSTPSPSMTTSG